MRPRMMWVALAFMLAQLCLTAAARAGGIGLRLAGDKGSSSYFASSAQRIGRNSLETIVGSTTGPFETEPSTGLLLVIGLGLIGGASLIGVKKRGGGAVEERENAGELAIFPKPARSHYGGLTPTMHMSKR